MLKQWKVRERERKGGCRGGDYDGVNKPFVCPSAVLRGLAWCLASRVIFFQNHHCHPCISIFAAVGATLLVCECVCALLVARSFRGLIMQGLGKTERGETGRDIDLTSLRSTMPAGGQLQVSAPEKMEKRKKCRTGGERTEIQGKNTDAFFSVRLATACSPSNPLPLTLSRPRLLAATPSRCSCLSFAAELWYVLSM